MIKKLHLYIIREFLGYFFFGFAVFSAFFLLGSLFDFLNLSVSRGVPLFIILKLLAYIFPKILMSTIPMSVLLGILISYGRLSEDNEITAMKSSGINYKTLTIPILILVCIIFLFISFCNHFLVPSATSNFRKLFKEIIVKRPLSKLREKTINELGEYNIYANKIDYRNNTLSEVSIYKFENKNDKKNALSKAYRISASSATIKPHPNAVQITLYNGHISYAYPSDMNDMVYIIFRSYCFFITLYNEIKEEDLIIMGMSSPEILKTMKVYKEQNIPFTNYEVEFWTRWIFAFASIASAFIALPIGIMTEKGGKGIGFGVSLGLISVYYALTILVIELSEKRYAPPIFIMWLPNIIVMIIGIYLLIKMRKK
jgi:lipopolysaccharide export system permease protein